MSFARALSTSPASSPSFCVYILVPCSPSSIDNARLISLQWHYDCLFSDRPKQCEMTTPCVGYRPVSGDLIPVSAWHLACCHQTHSHGVKNRVNRCLLGAIDMPWQCRAGWQRKCWICTKLREFRQSICHNSYLSIIWHLKLFERRH